MRGGGSRQPAGHNRSRAWLHLTAAVGLFLLGVSPAAAEQPQVPRQAYLEQRVKDLMDYRNYLEDQVAAARALIEAQQKTLATVEANLKACREPAAPSPKP